MSSNTLEVNGGANIKPSARKSIHSHCNTCIEKSYINMGKYGLKNRRNEDVSKVSSREPGVDEIDNVMSKLARQASPIPTRRNNESKNRRNSFQLVTDDYSDEESDDDEELYNSALQNELSSSRNTSSHSINLSPHRQNNISTENFHNSSLNLLQQNKNKSDKLGVSNNLLIAIIILLLSAIIYTQCVSDPVAVKYEYNKFNFDNDVKDLKEKYKVKDNSILQVKSGVATIFEKQDTASFIFAYNSNSNNFNLLRFNNFIDDIALTTSRYLRNESNKVHVTVDSSNLMMQTAKEFMNHYQNEVFESGVMLVKDIDSVPSQLAMAFHYYCDEYNPLVKQSAIFFTLNLAKCSNNSDKKATHENIEKCLANKWNTVDKEKIGPLLTRVVNIVVDVTQSF